MTQIDILEGLNQMALDVIGLAGFGYSFDALAPSGKNNPLRSALNEILNPAAPSSRLALIQASIPFFQWVPNQRKRKVLVARQSMLQIGAELLAQKKAALLTASENEGKGGIPSNEIDGSERDLLTLLIKANIANDLPENQRLSDDEVIAQIPTFIIAGHETSASAVTWCLFALSINVNIQDKLRKELRAVSTETPTMDELMALPYLDCVLRETLRLYPPVATSARQAMKDDVIPLNKPYVDTQGNISDSIQIRAGDHIIIPIAAINQMKEIWGDDAEEFRPERWDSPPSAATGIPGVWGNVLSFLGGPRACIGYRFGLVEFKALVFTLVRAFEFELAVPKEQVTKKSLVVVKPVIIGRGEKGNQMPMFIRPARG
ncbi:hypothetical protein NLI96_g9286 [Meripilus lineatus]|uniref:Cytochrome P450 n=1 Tax=Meripilus lineatus TaxID=2056292 RepID=A0AAD5V0Z2_9APHY|nr:hypothetical protein NLI96_g9286 [Physisporinus lineatus]